MGPNDGTPMPLAELLANRARIENSCAEKIGFRCSTPPGPMGAQGDSTTARTEYACRHSKGVEVERRGMRQRGSWLGAGGWATAYRWGRLDGEDLIPALLATMQPSLPAGREPKPNPPPSPALARAGKPGETEADLPLL
jgi:hypothetical protein